MIKGLCENGMTCVYELPIAVNTVEQFESLICGYSNNPAHREELKNQPKLLGLTGPMFNGYGILKSTGEEVAIIRYEK